MNKNHIKLLVSVYNTVYYISIVSILEYVILGFHFAFHEKFDGDFNSQNFLYFLVIISFVVANKIYWRTKMTNID